MRSIRVLAVFVVIRVSTLTAQVWVAQGPGPNTGGQVENIANREVVGAIGVVAAHPSNANVVYVGAVNGGIWRTLRALDPEPLWEAQTDDKASLSIGALAFDPTDSTNQTLVAGIGSFSNYGAGGARSGVLRTSDGITWTTLDGGGTLQGLNVSGVAPRGSTIVISANDADDPAKAGVWRTINTGRTWTIVSGATRSGLPAGPAADLASDPTDRARLFTIAGPNGIYRSLDTGATWGKVSTPEMDMLIASATNVKIAVGRSDNVYVAVVQAGQLANVFRSGKAGDTWNAMGVPTTSEGGVPFGVHPGRQGGINLSVVADPVNANLVYIGGDRQPSQVRRGAEVVGAFPNSIGAMEYSGRLFRGDASQPVPNRWLHITHSSSLGPSGGGTKSSSAPHADSRHMAIDVNGDLIEVDDGGIYRRTAPSSNRGDWVSMNGNLQATEFHSVAWDSVSKVVIGGAQDTGTPVQTIPASVRWRSVSTADGGCVAVDDSSTPGVSTRYSSDYGLGNFRRQLINAANAFQSEVFPAMAVLGNGSAVAPQFYTPIRLNTVNPRRLVIGAENAVFESPDQGDSVVEIGPSIKANEVGSQIIAYGAVDNPDVLYVGSGNRVFVRTGPHPSPLQRSSGYTGGFVQGIALDPASSRNAYAIDGDQVFRSTDVGVAWTPVTGNLRSLTPATLRAVAVVADSIPGVLVVGTDDGVFTARGPSFTAWSRLGTGLPVVPVLALEYSLTDHLLLAATLGRGAWTLPFGGPPPGPTVSSPAQRPLPSGTPFTSQATAATTSFQLRPGVVVDTASLRAFIMNPTGALDGVDLRSGRSTWSTMAAAKPLAISGERLIAQAESQDSPSRLPLVILDPATGQSMATAGIELPAGVRPSISATISGDFLASVRWSLGDPIISWQFIPRPSQGMRPGTPDTVRQPGKAPLQPLTGTASLTVRGEARLDLRTAQTLPIETLGTGLISSGATDILQGADRLPGLPDIQVLSADGRYVLVSELTANDTVFDKYTISILDRTTRNRVGQFRCHVSVVPFIVADSLLIYTTEPYTRTTLAGMAHEPLKLRAVDLTTGLEVWSREIRDTTFRGSGPGEP